MSPLALPLELLLALSLDLSLEVSLLFLLKVAGLEEFVSSCYGYIHTCVIFGAGGNVVGQFCLIVSVPGVFFLD